MKSNSFIYLAIAAVLVVAGGIYIFSGDAPKDAAMVADSAPTAEGDAMMEQKADDSMMEGDAGDAMSQVKGSFVDYSPERVAQASADNKTVLFFNASWCPKCQATTAALRSAGVPDGVTVLSVDYDANTALRQKYGVTYQHTFVQVDASGNEVAQWSGSADGADVASRVI
jgi:thioredoxin 1